YLGRRFELHVPGTTSQRCRQQCTGRRQDDAASNEGSADAPGEAEQTQRRSAHDLSEGIQLSAKRDYCCPYLRLSLLHQPGGIERVDNVAEHGDRPVEKHCQREDCRETEAY